MPGLMKGIFVVAFNMYNSDILGHQSISQGFSTCCTRCGTMLRNNDGISSVEAGLRLGLLRELL